MPRALSHKGGTIDFDSGSAAGGHPSVLLVEGLLFDSRPPPHCQASARPVPFRPPPLYYGWCPVPSYYGFLVNKPGKKFPYYLNKPAKNPILSFALRHLVWTRLKSQRLKSF